MTMSWHMMVEFEPPLVACVVSNANYSFAALRATKECVIALPALELAAKVVAIGNCSGRDIDKFERFGLTQAPAKCVAPPLVAECFANLECKVVDTRLVTSSISSFWRCSRHGSTRRKRVRRPFTITDTEGSPWMAR
jgi:flavin reductase (DIM6/NTAB) family NADH-FMN oxidoreductase RutF